jgi:hypothetical protein
MKYSFTFICEDSVGDFASVIIKVESDNKLDAMIKACQIMQTEHSNLTVVNIYDRAVRELEDA